MIAARANGRIPAIELGYSDIMFGHNSAAGISRLYEIIFIAYEKWVLVQQS